jgi:hypothetical protein
VEDFDLAFDQSDRADAIRVERRIAHGVYRITHNRKVVGEELWGVFALRQGGYRLMAEIDLTWPIPNQQRAMLDLRDDWLARKLWVQIDAEGKRRKATYTPVESEVQIEVYEEPLRYSEAKLERGGREQPLNLAASPPPRQVLQTRASYDDNTFLDFGSTLFNFAHLRRLNLMPDGANQRVEIAALVVTQPTLEPLKLVQTYAYIREEQVSMSLQPYIRAYRYLIEEREGAPNLANPPTATIWTDDHGIAIKQEVLLDKDVHGCELTSYQWVG